MVYKDKWYKIAETYAFPTKGSISLLLGDSSVIFYANSDFSSSVISLVNHSVVPEVTIEIRMQNEGAKRTVEFRFLSATFNEGLIAEISIITGANWIETVPTESVTTNVIALLGEVIGTGGSGAFDPNQFFYFDEETGTVVSRYNIASEKGVSAYGIGTVGSGGGGYSPISVIDDLLQNTVDLTKALSARQGYILSGKIGEKQDIIPANTYSPFLHTHDNYAGKAAFEAHITNTDIHLSEPQKQALASFMEMFEMDVVNDSIKAKKTIYSVAGVSAYGLGFAGGGGGGADVYNGLDSDSPVMALSALQGKVLKGLIDTHNHSGVYATPSYVDQQISALVASSPETLNTLNELAAALGNDPNFATTITNQIGTKEPGLGNPASDGMILSSSAGGIRSWVNRYVLPIATAAILGGVMIGTGLSATAQGVLSHSDFSIESGIGGSLGHVKASEKAAWNNHIADNSAHMSVDERNFFNKLKTYFVFAADNSSVHTTINFFSQYGVSAYGLGVAGGGGSLVNVIDNLSSTSITEALSANMGRYLNTLISGKSDTGHVHTWESITGKPVTFAPSAHYHDDRYYTETEIGNFFSGTTAISGYNKSYWDSAFGWGNHAGLYLPSSGGTLNSTDWNPLSLNTTASSCYLALKVSGVTKGYLGWFSTDGVFMQNSVSPSGILGVLNDTTPYYSANGGTTKHTLIHAGNYSSYASPLNHSHSYFYNGNSFGGDCNALAEDYKLSFTSLIISSATNLFPIINNANAIISIATHPGGYNHQLGFSSNGHIYSRQFSGGNAYNWLTIWDSGNLLNIGATASSARTALQLGTMATEAASNYLNLTNGGTITGDLTISKTYPTLNWLSSDNSAFRVIIADAQTYLQAKSPINNQGTILFTGLNGEAIGGLKITTSTGTHDIWHKGNLTHNISTGAIPYWNGTNLGDSYWRQSGNEMIFSINNDNSHRYLSLNKNSSYDGGILWQVDRVNKWQMRQDNDGGLSFYSYISGTWNVHFTGSGNVGIGNTNPLAKIDLGSTYGMAKLYLYNDGTYVNGFGIYANEFRSFFDTIDAALSRMTWGKQSLAGSFTEFMRLTKEGNFDIGYAGSRGEKFAVNGSGYFNGNLSNLGHLWVKGVGNYIRFDTLGVEYSTYMGTVNNYDFRIANTRGSGCVLELNNNGYVDIIGELYLRAENQWRYFGNPAPSGGIRMGAGNASGTWVNAFDFTVAGNWVRSYLPFQAIDSITATSYIESSSYLKGTSVKIGANWEAIPNGTTLELKFNGITKARINSNGDLVAYGGLSAYGIPQV